MDKTFCCDASRLAWKLYETTHEWGMLTLFLNLENDFIKVNELSENYSNAYEDTGMEL